ncbi:MAG: hypothetical protein ABRQ26_16435, partial [Syntrophomonadaceae bacterium]
VEKYLNSKTACMIAVPRRLKVQEPRYCEISISSVIVARDLEYIPLIENQAAARLSGFLHPLTGGDEGQGWGFGKVPHLSDFYAILENIEGVDYVQDMQMTVIAPGGSKYIAAHDRPFSAVIKGDWLVYSGAHTVDVIME